MTDISSEQVKELRERTGISVMECKEVLEEANGDIDKAVTLLDERGSKKAAKKAERELGSGVINAYVHANKKAGAMIELCCETDFVARNEEFQELAYNIAMHIAAMDPEYIREDEIDEEEKEELKNSLVDEELEEKPEDIQEEIIAGKMEKYLSENVLMSQPYVKDDEKTIEEIIEDAVQKFGENIAVGEAARFETIDR